MDAEKALKMGAPQYHARYAQYHKKTSQNGTIEQHKCGRWINKETIPYHEQICDRQINYLQELKKNQEGTIPESEVGDLIDFSCGDIETYPNDNQDRNGKKEDPKTSTSTHEDNNKKSEYTKRKRLETLV